MGAVTILDTIKIWEESPMPVYEYQCNACESCFEMRQNMSDPPEKVCPKCGGELTKMVSGAAFKLKFRKYSKR
jgi:putative FmdB family regulatory protein